MKQNLIKPPVISIDFIWGFLYAFLYNGEYYRPSTLSLPPQLPNTYLPPHAHFERFIFFPHKDG